MWKADQVEHMSARHPMRTRRVLRGFGDPLGKHIVDTVLNALRHCCVPFLYVMQVMLADSTEIAYVCRTINRGDLT